MQLLLAVCKNHEQMNLYLDNLGPNESTIILTNL